MTKEREAVGISEIVTIAWIIVAIALFFMGYIVIYDYLFGELEGKTYFIEMGQCHIKGNINCYLDCVEDNNKDYCINLIKDSKLEFEDIIE